MSVNTGRNNADIDELINTKWNELYNSYVHMKNPEATASTISIPINLSQDIPNLLRLIESNEHTEILQQELKQIIMKYYWIGFLNGNEQEQKKLSTN